MKSLRFVLSFMFVFAFTLYGNAGSIKIKKSGGGCNGYDDVEEYHDNNNNHRLTCSDPGQAACDWQFPPTVTTQSGIVVQPANIQNYVQHEIANGITHGTVYWGDSGEVIAVWSEGSINPFNEFEYELTIYVNEVPPGL